jgi:glycosyltransferase involved in cell wall biosynthesis
VSPRIQKDLIQQIRVPAARSFCAPNALDLSPYANLARPPYSGPFRLLSLGRVVDTDKGLFWLPGILRELGDLDCTLTVAGEGPDLEELKRRCLPLGNRVTFLGRVGGESVPGLVASHDILVMPSRFEGFGYTLIEAMAGGCVPVATRLQGVTDFVVKDGITGFLFPAGDLQAAAEGIRRLKNDAGLFKRMSDAGRADVEHRFSIKALSQSYAPVLDSLKQNPHPPKTRYGTPFRPLQTSGIWRRFIPNNLKNLWRQYFLR